MVLKHSIIKSGWSVNPQAHWEKMLPGFSILQWDTIDMEVQEEVSASWLGFGAFSWESRVGPRHWRKAFLFVCFFSPHLSLCQLCNSLFIFVLLLSIHGLIFVSFWFFWTNHRVRKRWTTDENAHSFRNTVCSSTCIYFCRNTESLI